MGILCQLSAVQQVEMDLQRCDCGSMRCQSSTIRETSSGTPIDICSIHWETSKGRDGRNTPPIPDWNFQSYECRTGAFANATLWSLRDHVTPLQWWDKYVDPLGLEKLVAIAIELCMIPCSSACVERCWKAHTFYWTKSRSELRPETVEKLVKVKYFQLKDNPRLKLQNISLEELPLATSPVSEAIPKESNGVSTNEKQTEFEVMDSIIHTANDDPQEGVRLSAESEEFSQEFCVPDETTESWDRLYRTITGKP